MHLGVGIWLIGIAAGLVESSPRLELSLNGRWEVRIAGDLTYPPPSGEGTPCTVPGYLRGHDHARAWFRRPFTVPDGMRGKRLKISFGGVKYNSRVYVNGKQVGGCFGGYRPFEVDVTGAVRFGRPNELLVGCQDWTGVFTPGRVDLGATGGWSQLRSIPRDKILAPIGGRFDLYGIWDDVVLRAHPAVHTKDLFIRPSVRRREIVVDYTLANESSRAAETELRAAVEDSGRDVLVLPTARVRLAAGETKVVTVRQPWPRPHLWSHVDPYLYVLRTELSTGDGMRTRFGFREFWVDGHNFILNGSKIHLLATSGWPPGRPMDRDEIRRVWEDIKGIGCVAFRTHTQPWPSLHYDVADECGLLMIIEGAVWNDDDVYRINDPVFWDNYARHLEGMVHHHRNRPSVILWSLENEFYGGRLNDESPAKSDLIRMGTLVKSWDPTRPILYESDGDPGGVADVIGIHYPHEYPFYTCWPNEAYWLDRPQETNHMFLNGEERFIWRKEKPLYVGEFLWLPSNDPSWHTVFFGDDAYIDYGRYRTMGKAESWKMAILGYRHFDVGGMCPWTVMEGGAFDEANALRQAHRYAYQPIAAFCHAYDRRFYARERVRRRVEIFNDVLETSDLTLAWTLKRQETVVEQGQQRLELGPGEQRLLEVVLPMPDAQRRTPVQWHLALQRSGRRVFEDTREYAVFPRRPLPALDARVGLVDPEDRTGDLLRRNGLKAARVASLEKIDADLDVIIVGAGSLKDEGPAEPIIGRLHRCRPSLLRFLTRGGRVLVLEQECYPEGLFAVDLSDHRSTMTFAAAPDHAALRGVGPEDLKFWRGDHVVTSREVSRPAAGAFLPIVVSGSAAGIDHVPLLERPVGQGCILHAQLQLIGKFSTEPIAARILANLLEYLAGYGGRARRTGVVGGSEAYRSYLQGLGLRFDDLSHVFADTDLSAYSLIICRGRTGDDTKLRRFAEQGGNLLLHRMAPEALDSFCRIAEMNIALQPYPGPVTRVEGDHPLLGAVTREDIYWLGEPIGYGAATTPRADGMADGIFAKTLEGKEASSHEVEEWALTGSLVERRPPGVTFATAGSASAEIQFPRSGAYIIGVVARGTPCHGIYPVLRVSLDEKPFGVIALSDSSWQTRTVFGRVEAGRRTVRIAFINDASDPPREDRNLHVDRVLVARDDPGTDITFLTEPPAVAAARRGRGMIVIDELRWDTEARNARKAARYACSILTAMGGAFDQSLGVVIECERMTPQPGLAHYSNRGSFVSLATNGFIKAPIRVAATASYMMNIVASGTQAEGVFPLVEVRIDGRKVGQVQLTGGGWRSYSLNVTLAAGTHELALAFTNDRYIPGGGDRNLELDRVLFIKR